jgi:hypothetical protein
MEDIVKFPNKSIGHLKGEGHLKVMAEGCLLLKEHLSRQEERKDMKDMMNLVK